MPCSAFFHLLSVCVYAMVEIDPAEGKKGDIMCERWIIAFHRREMDSFSPLFLPTLGTSHFQLGCGSLPFAQMNSRFTARERNAAKVLLKTRKKMRRELGRRRRRNRGVSTLTIGRWWWWWVGRLFKLQMQADGRISLSFLFFQFSFPGIRNPSGLSLPSITFLDFGFGSFELLLLLLFSSNWPVSLSLRVTHYLTHSPSSIHAGLNRHQREREKRKKNLGHSSSSSPQPTFSSSWPEAKCQLDKEVSGWLASGLLDAFAGW